MYLLGSEWKNWQRQSGMERPLTALGNTGPWTSPGPPKVSSRDLGISRAHMGGILQLTWGGSRTQKPQESARGWEKLS